MPKVLLKDAMNYVVEQDNGDVHNSYWCPVGDDGSGMWKTWIWRGQRSISVTLHDPVGKCVDMGKFPMTNYL